jgi:1-acyl-sn-glycerol-3-phosphate acyltransferase
MSWVHFLGHISLKTFFFLFTRLDIRGIENVPKQGSLLVTANHLSAMDPPLLGVEIGRPMIFMAKEELFHPGFLGYFMYRLGAFPVHRGRMDREALRRSAEVLARKKVLAMFPEGHRRGVEGYQPQGFMGAALIAERSGVPILPVGICGTERIKGWKWIMHRPRIIICIGVPFHLIPAAGKSRRDELATHTANIMDHIASLLPDEYRAKDRK